MTDLTRLNQLGKRHKKLRAELDELIPELEAEIKAIYRPGERPSQETIAEIVGYKRDNIRLLLMTPEEKADYNAKRRARAKKILDRVDEALEHPETFVERSRPRRAKGDEA